MCVYFYMHQCILVPHVKILVTMCLKDDVQEDTNTLHQLLYGTLIPS